MQHSNMSTRNLENLIYPEMTTPENITLVFGLRPVANMTWEKPSTVPLLVFKEKDPSDDLTIAWGVSSGWNSIPRNDICSPRKSLICTIRGISEIETGIFLTKHYLSWWDDNFWGTTSSSKPLRTFFCLINTWTSLFKPLKMPANSTAM